MPVERIEAGARRPRGKNRFHHIGVSRCRLLCTDGLDIKPYLAEATEILRDHY
ncbi:hypothetical protein [Streptomyces sviceus]|uniref:hypothetical protein n=1 Tax=Streptomyces sviceus TaxID=285530 RepID=UPI0036E11A79